MSSTTKPGRSSPPGRNRKGAKSARETVAIAKAKDRREARLEHQIHQQAVANPSQPLLRVRSNGSYGTASPLSSIRFKGRKANKNKPRDAGPNMQQQCHIMQVW